MTSFAERVTIFCFAASYAVALTLELWQLMQARPIHRLVSLGVGCAGLLAHTIYLLVKPLSLAGPLGSMLLLAWILAVFYLYGSIHHGRVAWGLFVLPVVLALIAAGYLSPGGQSMASSGLLEDLLSLRGKRFWAAIHGGLLLLGAVGVCVGFIASIMYLVQIRRLRTKQAPTHGIKMMSLERIESMNRHGILWAFPLLTAGLLVGIILRVQNGELLDSWNSPKVLSGLGLWLVFAILLYLRYGVHVRGRQVALWTMLAFVFLVMALMSAHPFVQGVEP